MSTHLRTEAAQIHIRTQVDAFKTKSKAISFTFFCRLHIGEKVESPLLTGSKAELGIDAQTEGILHSTSDAQLSLERATPMVILQALDDFTQHQIKA